MLKAGFIHIRPKRSHLANAASDRMTPIQGRWRRWKTRAHRTIPSTSIATNTPMSSCRLGVRLKDGRGER